MELVFLPSAVTGLKWFRRYYSDVFPAGEKRAIAQYERMKQVLMSRPHAGRPVGERDSRAYSIPRTPFTVVYRLRGDQIQVLLVLDQRAKPRRLP